MNTGEPSTYKKVEVKNNGDRMTVTKSAYGIQFKGSMSKFAYLEVSVTGLIRKPRSKKMVPCDDNHRMISKMCYESDQTPITEFEMKEMQRYIEYQCNVKLFNMINELNKIVVNLVSTGNSTLEIVEDK